MDTWLLLVLAVLATWRVTHLLAREDGPADIFFLLRKRLGDGLVGSLMDCFNCMSLCIATVAAFAVASGLITWLLSWLAISGGACLLERLGGTPFVERELAQMKGDNDVLR